MAKVFFSYSHADEALRDQLEKQLSTLKRQGVIETWHDRRIGAGEEFGRAIDEHVDNDEIILLLISNDFLASDYCYNLEMKRALERHASGDAIVIPVILRACDWRHEPLSKLLATPTDGKPITQWPDQDQAFLEVATAVREAAGRLSRPPLQPERIAAPVNSLPAVAPTSGRHEATGPRSSNLRLAKTFTQRDKDRFKLETFEFIALFFENSLAELGARNPGFEGAYRKVDANRFFATIYKDGRDVARATIYMGGAFGNGINFVQGETTQSNSTNEWMTVEADDQSLYLKSMGMVGFGEDPNRKLSQEGAAEHLWDLVIGPLQQRYWEE